MGRQYTPYLLLVLVVVLFYAKTLTAARIRSLEDGLIIMPSEESRPGMSEDERSRTGTRWAVLVAGSSGYANYRHQSDVCHAYQVLRGGGLKDKNIVVFMYDDIANSPANPRPGQIFNSPGGKDVYAGVPKDYTGKDVTVSNFYAVLLGNKTALTGGSGKVVESGPNDHVFIFYSDHGGPGVLGMPTNPNLFANDFLAILKKMHATGTYKEMVIYVEACESGSIFEGLLPKDLNIYVTTASNAKESSWGTYCPGMVPPPPPPEFYTCLGDLYSVSWMEDSEVHNLKEETVRDQFNTVKVRTSNYNTYVSGSHVMQYGDAKINKEELYLYIGSDPANDNLTHEYENMILPLSSATLPIGLRLFHERKTAMGVNQRDADLMYLWHKYKMANEGSAEKLEAQQEMVDTMSHRLHLDRSIELVGKLLFGYDQGPEVLKAVRPSGQPLVDDWSCLKAMVRTFESYCGSLNQYGMKHMRALANICNADIGVNRMATECAQVCAGNSYVSGAWNPLENGFSA